MSATSSLWYFEQVDLYDLLCPHKIPSMKEKHVFHHYQKNQFIYFELEPSGFIYLIASGRVKIGSYTQDGKENLKAILGPGEIFGELALAGQEVRTDFAQAMDEDTTICPMTIQDMQELMSANKPLNFKILKLIGLRLRKLERRLEALVFKDARTRIIEFLKDMAEERGKKVGFETMISNHLTHRDIASLTGTSRQTVTTILNELREKNIINFDRRRILIRDMALLK
jgi:CRP-like cAMP-binding protein